MSSDGRAKIFRRLRSPLDGGDGEPMATGPLSWTELGFVCQGLAFATRPLRQATVEVTREYDLGPRGAWILDLISNGVHYPKELAEVFAVGRSLITAELVRLESAGLITAQVGDRDRRRSQLALTPLGEQAGARIRDELSRSIRGNLARYSDDEVRQFAQMLRDVRGHGELS